jgi:diadenosine tetraphosphate (Ap4A) HIT family hydrolase
MSSPDLQAKACVFCSLPAARIRLSSPLALALDDAYPVSPGHMLIIPRRHVASFFDLENAEREAMLALLDQCRESLLAARQPDGFNLGLNDGPSAGQTVMHVHLHLIPRYRGDRADPRGGVRWVMPDKADYWSAP